MTSSSITEEEILEILSAHPRSFSLIKSSLWKERKASGVKLGSQSTISKALKGLHEKRLVEYDVTSRLWKITSLGRLMTAGDVKVPSSAKELARLTQPLSSLVEKNPGQLLDLLSAMFTYFSMSSGKLPISEELLLKQTRTRLTLVSKGNSRAIGAIWIDAVERLIGHFSCLMAAILLFRSSTLDLNETQASATIHQIVQQWFRTLSAELATFLSKYLANLEDLTTLETKISNSSRRQPL